MKESVKKSGKKTKELEIPMTPMPYGQLLLDAGCDYFIGKDRYANITVMSGPADNPTTTIEREPNPDYLPGCKRSLYCRKRWPDAKEDELEVGIECLLSGCQFLSVDELGSKTQTVMTKAREVFERKLVRKIGKKGIGNVDSSRYGMVRLQDVIDAWGGGRKK
jgi:hypothetical protein